MRYYLILLILCFNYNNLIGQQCNASGAQINTSLQTIKNIKTDFGAIGDGSTNDQNAFIAAASYINQNFGNVKLIIPDGIYLVGNQISNIGNASYSQTVYSGEPIMVLNNVSNVSIIGSSFSKIIFKDGMKVGTFDVTTGQPPTNLDLYNPSADASVSINLGSDYKYAGTVGNFLQIITSYNIEVKNLEINGNSDKYELGGNWGLGDRPIELNNCYGVVLDDVYNCTLYNLRIHHFGLDNLLIMGDFISGDTSLPKSHNIFIDRVFCEFAGRNNFSWVGGKNICVLNSSFNHASIKAIKTKPGYGMDIEPEGITGEVVCSGGYFFNNMYADNAGLGLVTGTSIDNPIYGLGNGYSYNHYFYNCKLVGKYNSTTHNYINRVTFESCKFYGQVINYGSSINNIEPAKFINSRFSDCYNGERMYDKPLLSIEYGYKMLVSNCSFHKFFSSGQNSWIYFYGTSGDICSEDRYKPIFENSIFNFYEPDDAVVKYLSIGRRIKFDNNEYYKDGSNNLRWYNPTGCDPGVGEGNVDLGLGLQYNSWPTNYTFPDCEEQFICEDNIYLSIPITTGRNYFANDFVIVDAETTLSANNQVVFQADNYIQLNPGFNSNLSGNANIEFKIGNCTNEYELKQQPGNCIQLQSITSN